MPRDYIPSREPELVTWSGNFSAGIAADPAAVGLTDLQATTYASLNTAWVSAYDAANSPATGSPSAIITKNKLKRLLVANARLLAGIIQKFPGTTDTQRSDLRLTVRNPARSPLPVPEEMPNLVILSREGSTVIIRLHDNTSQRAKPPAVAGASIFTHVGATAPIDITAWRFEGNTTRTSKIIVNFDVALPAGTVVWFTAFWFNPRGLSGPGCAPVSAILPGGAMSMAAQLALAA